VECFGGWGKGEPGEAQGKGGQQGGRGPAGGGTGGEGLGGGELEGCIMHRVHTSCIKYQLGLLDVPTHFLNSMVVNYLKITFL